MEEKSFIARLLEKKGLLLLIGGIILLPIILLAANTQTNLFSRASTDSQNGFVVHRTDPLTGEFFDLIVSTYHFKTIIENNISNKANVTFRISGDNSRLISRKTIYGGVRQSNTSPYIKTFNFVTEGSGVYTTYTSDPVELNVDNACIDLHGDENRSQQNYIATFCYKLSFLNNPSSQGRIYSYTANPYIELTYTGTKPAAIISMTTAFDRYAPFKGIRVNYFSQDEETNSRDFKDVIYNIQGLTSGMTLAQNNELCSLDPKYPEKYLRFGRSFWYEGGELIQLTETGSGGCSFTTKQASFIGGWMNLWTETMFKQQQPSVPLTKTPTEIALTKAVLSKTPTPTISKSSFCRIDSRLPTSQDDKNITVNIKAQGGPGTAWRLTRSSPLQQITSGSIVNNQIEFTSTLQWGVRYTLQIQTSPNRWYSSPGCSFFYDKPTSPISGVPTKAATPLPTRTRTPTLVPSTNSPSPVTQKTWTFNLIAQCPSGTVIKSTFKPGWYWWDSIDGSDADVATSAIVSGFSDRLFYFRIFDNSGTLKPVAPSANMSVTSENYLRWNGTYSNGTYTIRYEARASSCTAQ